MSSIESHEVNKATTHPPRSRLRRRVLIALVVVLVAIAFSKRRSGRFPLPGEVEGLLKARLGA